MNGGTWHAGSAILARYVGGDAGPTERQSIETHLLACELCRSALAEIRGPSATAERVWQGVMDRVDRPRVLLRWSTGSLAVSVASPALLLVTVALAAMLLAAVGLLSGVGSNAALPLFLALAPLVPVAGAVIAFRPGTDPADTLAEATPWAGGRLPFLRAAFSIVVAATAGLCASLFTSLGWSSVLVWLGPGLALATGVAATATWTDPTRFALTACGLWGLLVVTWARGHQGTWTRDALDDLAASRPAVQLACIGASVIAALICILRRDAQPGWRTA